MPIKDTRHRCPSCLRQETNPYGSIVDASGVRVDLYVCNVVGCRTMFLPFVIPGFVLRGV